MRRRLPRRASRTIECWRPVPPERFVVRNTVVMILLAIFAAATWVATWEPQGETLAAGQIEDTEPLGYYMRGASFSVTDDQGRFTYRVFADRLDELPDDQRLQLTGVTVEYRPSDEAAWSLSAATASYARDGSQLVLNGGVEVRSVPAEGSVPWTVHSEALHFWPETSKVESQAAVEIHAGDWRLVAMGLRMDLKEKTLELESQVHGTLLP
jgi:LPS export ABC transporter protein LptC